MRERITDIYINQPDDASQSVMLHMSVYTENPVRGTPLDAMVTKLTGMEATSLDVSGGPSSFGGSVYTGIKTNDREVVLTLKPRMKSPGEIKAILNALVGRSMHDPLRFTAVTQLNDAARTQSQLFGDCYISGVTAPLLDADNTIQVTLKFPKSYFQRNYNETANLGNSLIRYNGSGTLHVHEYQIEGMEYGDITFLNAPSPFTASFVIDQKIKQACNYVELSDYRNNLVRVHLDSLFDPGGAIASGYLKVTISSDTRSVRVESGGFEVDRSYYVTTHRGEWPMIRPAEPLPLYTIGMLNHSGSIANDHRITELTVSPRVFGI